MVSHQTLFEINGNHGHKLASRICQGAATLSFGPLDHVSCLGPLGARPGVLHHPKVFINNRHPPLGFGFCLDYSVKNSFAVHRFVRPPTREINHTSVIWLCSFLFLLVFFVARAGISLLGEVNLVRDSVDNQRSCGAKIAGFDISI